MMNLKNPVNLTNLKYYIYFSLLSVNCSLLLSCFNPFSPRIDNTTSNENIITDQKTVEGLFQNFKYSYTFKDSTIYGQLLTEDFVFTYFDYDLGVDVSWDRATDMRTTEGLFSSAQDLKLVWNNIVFQEGDSLDIDVKRSFNLSITFNPNDVVSFFGFVDMTLTRPAADDKWRIKRWRDLTNP
ncbi:MAG TPA: hypothetical protein VGK25_10455 [Ignavibacteria bacterium]